MEHMQKCYLALFFPQHKEYLPQKQKPVFLRGAQTPQERDYVLEIKTSTYRVKQLDVFRKIKQPTGSNHLKKEQKCGQICGAVLFSTRGDLFPP